MKVDQKFIWWIEERYRVYLAKEAGLPKPWSRDETFQRTYFCNVHRENDRVTKWIREHYHISTGIPEFNMIIARLVNKPSSLEDMGWPFKQWGELGTGGYERDRFWAVMSQKGSWGSAYIVSTNGRAMPKHEYISGLLTAAYSHLNGLTLPSTCLGVQKALMGVQGLASFMSAQIVADLKNTQGHDLCQAEDWWTFVAPGPGSLRGMAWVTENEKLSPSQFQWYIPWLREHVGYNISTEVPEFCNQDLQNCLCEFDKYMRVSTGTGRSKRKYAGV